MTSTFREPIKVVADILAHEIPLDNGYITLNNQKWNIPKDESLFVHLSYIGPSKVIANTNEMDSAQQEVQSSTVQSLIQIDWMSYNSDARTKMHEIGMALASMHSQRLQELYQCQIAKNVAPPVETSDLEGSGRLNRFTTTISVTALFTKTKAAEYYETFQQPEILSDPEVIPT